MPKPLTEADFHGPYTHERTGLQYENFGSYFAGEEPLDTDRNACIRWIAKDVGKSFDDDTGDSWPEGSVEIYWRAYDACQVIEPDPRGDHGAPHQQRNVAGIDAVKREIDRQNPGRPTFDERYRAHAARRDARAAANAGY